MLATALRAIQQLPFFRAILDAQAGGTFCSAKLDFPPAIQRRLIKTGFTSSLSKSLLSEDAAYDMNALRVPS